ncbi:3d45b6a9-878f-4845-a518-561dca03d877 [Sclerotinia trifoliorum]|uniref:3d45b6a9-878f-4845-a518-561dca03d877 n=1 Tax=Sclerotinia trifoliorum TaxID=28548 RepID=A0A8H2ZLC9_9HELO|nr:3d45b6a9-878f-4845-a518-561dca03d877 [Sclerotinia trifoliorum]
MSRTHTNNTSADGRQYFLITNVTTTSNANTEFDLQAEPWRLPYSINDSDLTFDGKPLNMLYEENRCMAEEHVTQNSHDCKSHDNSKGRGRSRQRK